MGLLLGSIRGCLVGWQDGNKVGMSDGCLVGGIEGRPVDLVTGANDGNPTG